MARVVVTDADVESVSRFRLEPYEDLLGGVRFRDGTLRLGPTTGAIALTGLQLAFGLLCVALGIATANPLFLFGAAPALWTLRYLRCRVVATDGSIVVVNKWHRRSLSIDEVEATAIEAFQPGLGFLPFVGLGNLWPRRLVACWLILRTGPPVRCDALVGLPAERRPLAPTPIEAKHAILERWIRAAVDDRSVSPAGRRRAGPARATSTRSPRR